MSHSLFAINISLHDSVLVDTNGRQHIKRFLITRINPIEDQTHDDFLPRWTTLVPKFRFFEIDNVTNILHDSVQGTCSQDFVFVIVGDGYK